VYQMRCMCDYHCTRGYYIGHPCRDFRRPCTYKAFSSVRLDLSEAQADACASIS